MRWGLIAASFIALGACAQAPRPGEIRFTNSTGAPGQVTMMQTFCCGGILNGEASSAVSDQWEVPPGVMVIRNTACLPVSMFAGVMWLKLEPWQAEADGAQGVHKYDVEIAPTTTETLAAAKRTNRTLTASEGIPLMLGLVRLVDEELVLPARPEESRVDSRFQRDELARYDRAVAAAGGRDKLGCTSGRLFALGAE